jgi:hypothetical protein
MFVLEYHYCVNEVMSWTRPGNSGRRPSEHAVRVVARRLPTACGTPLLRRGEQALREHIAATYPPYFGIDARTTTTLRAMVVARVFDCNRD